MKKIILIGLIFFCINIHSQDSNKGILSVESRTELVEELSQLTGSKIEKTNTIILNFFIKPKTEPNGSCIDYYINDKLYLKFLKKYKNIIQYYIVEQMYNYKSKKVVEDKNGEIKKLLFGNADFCGNYIIIEPNGEYIKKYGEYQQDEIPKLIKKR